MKIGSGRFSFVPIRPGTYDLHVGNVPLAVGRPAGAAGVQAAGRHVLGRFMSSKPRQRRGRSDGSGGLAPWRGMR
jgi:hypothetical protein